MPFTTRKRWRKQVLAQGVEEEDEEPLPPPPPPTAAGLRERAPLKRGLGGGKREDSQGSVAVEEMCFAMYVEHIPGSAWHSPGSHSCSVAYWVPRGWLQSSFTRSTVFVQYSTTNGFFSCYGVFLTRHLTLAQCSLHSDHSVQDKWEPNIAIVLHFWSNFPPIQCVCIRIPP